MKFITRNNEFNMLSNESRIDSIYYCFNIKTTLILNNRISYLRLVSPTQQDHIEKTFIWFNFKFRLDKKLNEFQDWTNKLKWSDKVGKCTTTNLRTHWTSCKPNEHVRHRGGDKRTGQYLNLGWEEERILTTKPKTLLAKKTYHLSS